MIELRKKNQRRRQGDAHEHEDDEETKRGRLGGLPWPEKVKKDGGEAEVRR